MDSINSGPTSSAHRRSARGQHSGLGAMLSHGFLSLHPSSLPSPFRLSGKGRISFSSRLGRMVATGAQRWMFQQTTMGLAWEESGTPVETLVCPVLAVPHLSPAHHHHPHRPSDVSVQRLAAARSGADDGAGVRTCPIQRRASSSAASGTLCTGSGSRGRE